MLHDNRLVKRLATCDARGGMRAQKRYTALMLITGVESRSSTCCGTRFSNLAEAPPICNSSWNSLIAQASLILVQLV